MSAGMAVFHSELRDALRDANPPARRETPPPANLNTPHKGDVKIGLWLPLTPLWLILAPFALVLSPLLHFAPQIYARNRSAVAVRSALVARPFRTALALGSVLLAMSGTVVEVDAPGARIRIRIF